MHLLEHLEEVLIVRQEERQGSSERLLLSDQGDGEVVRELCRTHDAPTLILHLRICPLLQQ